MSYVLYYSPGAASLAAHWMLIHIGAPFEAVAVDLKSRAHKEAAYLKLNPSGLVPTLVVEGEPLSEISALLMLLAERHPEAGLAPAPGASDRGSYLRWMVYLANTLQPPFRLWFYPEEAAGPDNAEAAGAVAREKIEAVWDRLDAELSDGRPYLLGDKLSAADFLATMLTRWSRNMPKPATEWPHLGAYVARMKALPSLQDVHAREGLTEWIAA